MKNIVPEIPVIVGPTASGKSAVAHSLARQYGWEIVSCDSRQLYKGLDIGTAKPSKKELSEVPYHLIDVLDVSQEYSAAHWASDALTAIDDILARGKQPLIVGGTLFYFQALQEGVVQTEQQNDDFRKQCHMREERHPGILHQELLAHAPERAQQLHPHDIQRIIRALSVALGSDKSFDSPKTPPPYSFISLALMPERMVLYDRINRRVEQMVESGLVEEVVSLIEKEQRILLPGLKSVGYQEFFKYIEKEQSLSDVIAKIQQNSRKYAKRQSTWLRNKFHADYVIDTTHLTKDEVVIEAKTFLHRFSQHLFEETKK